MSRPTKEIEYLQHKNEEYKSKIIELRHEVKSWVRNCAIVAGSSLGILLFSWLLSDPESSETLTEAIPCPECELCPEPMVCPEVACPECEDCNAVATQTQNNSQNVNHSTSKPNTDSNVVSNENFPREYTIQPGDTFSKIASKVYKHASWAQWLADQNNIDPSKLQVGQKITLPEPKE